MAAPSIGTLLVSKQPRRTYRKGQGWVIELEYEGVDTQLDTLTLLNPLEVQRFGSGPIRTLTATFSCDVAGTADPDQKELLWDFDCNEIEKSIFCFTSTVNDQAGNAMAQLIKEQIKSLEDKETTVSAALDYLSNQGATADDLQIMGLYQSGVEGVPISQAVVRMTLTFDKYTTNTNVSYSYINRVYTTAALIDENPSLANEPITLEGLWLKKCPKTSALSNGKYQLTQEWWGIQEYEQWIYGALIDVV